MEIKINTNLDNEDLLNYFDYDHITKSQFNYFINKTFLKGCNDFDVYQIFWKHFNEAIKEVENVHKTKRFNTDTPRSRLC